MNLIVVFKDNKECLINVNMITSIIPQGEDYLINLIDGTSYTSSPKNLHKNLLYNKDFQLLKEKED